MPDAETAIRIAIAVWEPIYEEEQIQRQTPFYAQLNNGICTVTGSLPKDETVIDDNGRALAETTVGGVAVIEIIKDTGCIVRVSHGE